TGIFANDISMSRRSLGASSTPTDPGFSSSRFVAVLALYWVTESIWQRGLSLFVPLIAEKEAAVTPSGLEWRSNAAQRQVTILQSGRAAASWDFGKTSIFPPSRQGRSLALQPKLTVGAVDDRLEYEADRVAEQVTPGAGQEYSVASGASRA